METIEQSKKLTVQQVTEVDDRAKKISKADPKKSVEASHTLIPVKRLWLTKPAMEHIPNASTDCMYIDSGVIAGTNHTVTIVADYTLRSCIVTVTNQSSNQTRTKRYPFETVREMIDF